MSFLDFVILLIISGVCGSIAQSLVGYSHTGCLGSIALGFIGALLGMWLARTLQLPELIAIEGFPVVWSIIGGALFAAVLALIVRPRRLD